MIAEHITEDGYILRVFSTCYMDWGLEVLKPNGDELFYSPHYLSNECYGTHTEDEEGDVLEEGIPWTEKEWEQRLKEEADDLLEGCEAFDASCQVPREWV